MGRELAILLLAASKHSTVGRKGQLRFLTCHGLHSVPRHTACSQNVSWNTTGAEEVTKRSRELNRRLRFCRMTKGLCDGVQPWLESALQRSHLHARDSRKQASKSLVICTHCWGESDRNHGAQARASETNGMPHVLGMSALFSEIQELRPCSGGTCL